MDRVPTGLRISEPGSEFGAIGQKAPNLAPNFGANCHWSSSPASPSPPPSPRTLVTAVRPWPSSPCSNNWLVGEMARGGGALLVKEEMAYGDTVEWEELFSGSVIIVKTKFCLKTIF